MLQIENFQIEQFCKVSFSHLHYNVIHCGCEGTSSLNYYFCSNAKGV